MLIRALYLSTIWLIIALIGALMLGTRIRRNNVLLSLTYLLFVVTLGDVLALLMFANEWEVIAASGFFLFCAFWLMRGLRDWNPPGQVLSLASTLTVALYLIYALEITAFSPLSPFSEIFSFAFFAFQFISLSLLLTYTFEALDVLCRVNWHRASPPLPAIEYPPLVSLHVPAYSEPPELVEKTLRALARLDYPNYEVILVDNNTPNESQWQPLVAVCRELGFKCVHLDRWPGYKSGALNFALALTDPRAELIGVIDADYIVEPDYLKSTVAYFADPQLGFLQTPQDYREYEGNRFLQAAYDAYKYFFEVSMPARNERNAIIFGGTMGLVRKSVLQKVGGWDEWCITEDAELSLRILKEGYSGLYINRTFGRGLMPLNFEGLKKQRFRWAFGGIQILKKHWEDLMPWAHLVDPRNRLTFAQRYFYLAGALQWFTELLTFILTVILLIGVFSLLGGRGTRITTLTDAMLVIPLVLIGTGLLRALWALKYRLRLTERRAVDALSLWFSLSWVVALACWEGLVQARGVFLRTPKAPTQSRWFRALWDTSWETMLGLVCLISGLALAVSQPSWFTIAIFAFCGFQSAIYLSAPWQSALSLRTASGRSAILTHRSDIRGRGIMESRVGRIAAGFALASTIVAIVVALEPGPAEAPGYASLQPEKLVPTAVFGPLSIPTLGPLIGATPLPTSIFGTAGTLTRTPVASLTPFPTLTLVRTIPPALLTATARAILGTATPALGPLPTATPRVTLPGTPTHTPVPLSTPTPTAIHTHTPGPPPTPTLPSVASPTRTPPEPTFVPTRDLTPTRRP